jgi:hypothetical protein
MSEAMTAPEDLPHTSAAVSSAHGPEAYWKQAHGPRVCGRSMNRAKEMLAGSLVGFDE